MKKPMTKTAITESARSVPGAIRFISMTAATTVAAPSASAPRMAKPPVDQAPSVGGMETSTAAKPPSATNPMTPTLNSPAKPHCRFTPSAMIEEIRPMAMISRAEFQLCAKPV